MIQKLSPLPDFLINRYKDWKLNHFSNNSEKFKKLASLGQSPSTMVISCCDSRIHATSIFGAEEGEFFIHRNIANLVPPYSDDGQHYATSAAIEYATEELKIRHLIILGHTGCGGIKGSYDLHKHNINPKHSFVNKWLSITQPIFKNISENIPRDDHIKQLEEESIKNSLDNLFTFPNVKRNIEEEKLLIHGMIHDIGSGTLKVLNPITHKFEKI